MIATNEELEIAQQAAELSAAAGWRWSGNPGALRGWRETRLQRLEATVGLPTTVYADGRLLASYPAPYTTLPRAHLLMLLHPNLENVFAVGCVADGSIEAMARSGSCSPALGPACCAEIQPDNSLCLTRPAAPTAAAKAPWAS